MVQKLKGFAKDKKIVGLTGVFGSGKSSVGRLFAREGAFYLEADPLAWETLREGNRLYPRVAALFKEAVDPVCREIDRKKLAEIVFEDPDRKRQLEAVVHPYVFDRLAEEVAAAKEKVAVIEVPLLFEAGFDRFCDDCVVVTAAEKVIRRRLCRKGFSEKEIEKRFRAQMDIEEKKEKADFIIENSGSLDQAKTQVIKIWNKLNAN